MERITTQTRVIREGAQFESRESFNAHCSMVDTTAPSLARCGAPLDYLSDNTYATSTDEHHVLIVGDTGCGKTRRLVVPTIRLLSKTGQSMVISDPKGELYRKTAKGLEKRGYDVRVLNFRNPRMGQRWNPFTVIENLYKSDNPDYRDKAQILLEDVMNTLKATIHSTRDVFWENLASQFLSGIALSILEFGEPGSLSFRSLAAMESEIIKCVQKSDDGEAAFSAEGMNSTLLKKYVESLPPGSAIRENLNSALESVLDPRMIGSVAGTTHTMANSFTKQDVMRSMLSDTDFDIKDLGRKPTAFFLILPDDSDAMYPLATMFVNQVYSQMIDLAYENGERLPNPVSFVLDEFANFTKLPNFKSMLTASRSRGMRFFLVVQDIDQLETQYSPTEAAIIISNCQDWVFMGCRNLNFLEMLVRISGIHYDKYTGERSPLITMTDLLTLQQGETVVWIRSCNPKRCWLPDYSDVDFGEDVVYEADLPPQNRAEPKKVCSFMDIMENASRKFEKEQEEKDEYEIDVTRYFLNDTVTELSDISEDDDAEEDNMLYDDILNSDYLEDDYTEEEPF